MGTRKKQTASVPRVTEPPRNRRDIGVERGETPPPAGPKPPQANDSYSYDHAPDATEVDPDRPESVASATHPVRQYNDGQVQNAHEREAWEEEDGPESQRRPRTSAPESSPPSPPKASRNGPKNG